MNTTYSKSTQTESEKKFNEMRFQEYGGNYYSYTRSEWLPIKNMDPHHIINALRAIEQKMEGLLTKLGEEGSSVFETYNGMPRPDLYRAVSRAYTSLEKEAKERNLINSDVKTPVVETTASVVAVSESKIEVSPTPIETINFSSSSHSQKRIINTLKSNGIHTLEDLATFSLLDFATFWLITPEAAWSARKGLKSHGLSFAKPEDSRTFKTQIAWPANTKVNSQRLSDVDFYEACKKSAERLAENYWAGSAWKKEAHLLIERIKARLLSKSNILGKRIILRPFNYVADSRKAIRKSILTQSVQRLQALNLEGDMNDRVLAYVTRNVDDVVDAITDGITISE